MSNETTSQKPAPDGKVELTLSDDDLLAVIRACGLSGGIATIRARWKDGIDIDEPTHDLRKLADAITARSAASVPPPDGAATSSIPASDDAATLAGSTERASTCGHAPCVGIETSSPGAAEPDAGDCCHNEGATFCHICGLAKVGRVVPDKASPPDDVRCALADKIGYLQRRGLLKYNGDYSITDAEFELLIAALRSAPVSKP